MINDVDRLLLKRIVADYHYDATWGDADLDICINQIIECINKNFVLIPRPTHPVFRDNEESGYEDD